MEVSEDGWDGPQVSGSQLSFISSWECPFAQRVWIALLEKGMKFDKQEVDLREDNGQYAPEKRAVWVKRLNPVGKVPILCMRHGEGDTIHSVYESLICNELLEVFGVREVQEMQPEPSLWPPTCALGRDGVWDKARGRVIIAAFGERFVPAFYGILLRQEEAPQQESAWRLAGACEWLDTQCDAEGPFFMGPKFSLVDAALAPFFLRLPALEHYRGFKLPQDCVKLREWSEAVARRPSVQGTCVSPKPDMTYQEYLIWVYERYAAGNAKSTSAADYR